MSIGAHFGEIFINDDFAPPPLHFLVYSAATLYLYAFLLHRLKTQIIADNQPLISRPLSEYSNCL